MSQRFRGEDFQPDHFFLAAQRVTQNHRIDIDIAGLKALAGRQHLARRIENGQKIKADIFSTRGEHHFQRGVLQLVVGEPANALRIRQRTHCGQGFTLHVLQMAVRHRQIGRHLVGQQAFEISVAGDQQDRGKQRQRRQRQKRHYPQTEPQPSLFQEASPSGHRCHLYPCFARSASAD